MSEDDVWKCWLVGCCPILQMQQLAPSRECHGSVDSACYDIISMHNLPSNQPLIPFLLLIKLSYSATSSDLQLKMVPAKMVIGSWIIFPNHTLTNCIVIDASHTQQQKRFDNNRWKTECVGVARLKILIILSNEIARF